MYEELVMMLRKHYDEHCPLDGVSGICGGVLANEAAEAIENTSKAYQMMAEAYEAEVTKPRWIPVTERLPEKRKWVLCWCVSDSQEALRWENNEWYHDPMHVYFSDFVTHWMPLPEPPKEET